MKLKTRNTKKMFHASRFKFQHAGFTIIEAIVAISVFAIAATSIVGVYLSIQRLNQASAFLQVLQQNGRFVIEDIAKTVRNGQIDYSRYPGGRVPQPATADLYLIDQEGIPMHVYQSGTDLLIEKTVQGSTLTTTFSSAEVRVLNFQAYVYPPTNPFPGGTEQPTVTVFLNLESTLNRGNVTNFPVQTTIATKQYPP